MCYSQIKRHDEIYKQILKREDGRGTIGNPEFRMVLPIGGS
jgi:hypothetical protein